MIFAEKLIQLRKKNGWSQEELAEQMNVTRQSVSKWEGAQSVPDLNKMIQLSRLFDVSLDYLLKDEIEGEETAVPQEEPAAEAAPAEPVRRVSMEEANRFLKIKSETTPLVALGVFLCIISPICLIILGAASEKPDFWLSENAAGGIGMCVLLILVAAAVVLFIFVGNKTSPFAYLEKELFETEYGVSGMVKERREAYRETYNRSNIIGTCLCILSLLPLFGGIIFSEEDTFMALMVSLLLFFVGIGVTFFIRAGIPWASFEKLLQEGEYTKKKKRRQPLLEIVSSVYWLAVTAVYLAWSFYTFQWHITWIIWPVAGVVYPIISNILEYCTKEK